MARSLATRAPSCVPLRPEAPLFIFPFYGVIDAGITHWLCFAPDQIHKFTVDLPKKHGKGGQSAQRFARLRMEKRHNYVRKVAEHAGPCYSPSVWWWLWLSA